jgi:hypothetical protein
MTKYPTIKSSMKFILAFFAATMMCAVFFAIPASADEYTWNAVVGGQAIIDGDSVVISSTSIGDLNVPAGAEITVTGNNGGAGFAFHINLAAGASVNWEATVSGQSSVWVAGNNAAETSVSVSGSITSSSQVYPALSIVGITETIDITSSFIGHSTNITNGYGIAITGCTGADVTITAIQVNVDEGSGDAIYVNGVDSLTIGTTDDTVIVSCTTTNTGHALNLSNIANGTTIVNAAISNNVSASKALIKSTSDLTINAGSFNSYHTAIDQTGETLTVTGGTITGGDNGDGAYGIRASNATVSLEDGNITSSSSDAENDAAVKIMGDSDLTISGDADIDGGNVNGLWISNSDITFEMTGGSVTGKDGIHATSGLSMILSGGIVSAKPFSNSNDAAIHIADVDTVEIKGNVRIIGGNASGVSITDLEDSLCCNFTMSGGEISGNIGLDLTWIGTANITGGTITSTGNNPGAGISISYGEYVERETPIYLTANIGGNVNINGGTYGVYINQNYTPALTIRLNINGGTISGGTGLFVEQYDTATITGGTISGTGVGGFGIIDSTGGTVAIAPTVSVTVQGRGSALDATPTVTTPYYYTGENYDGSDRIPFRSIETPFANDLIYKYVQFLVAEPIFPTAPPPVSDPGPSTPMEYPTIPTINPPSVDGQTEWIEVIATLNKSGTVNSKQTAADVAAAHKTADKLNIAKIKLIITEEGTGISKSAMQKIYKAADGTPIYLTFDFYETAEDEKSDGNLFVKLNGKTGQILTRIDFDSARIDSAESYINNRFDTEILGTFETTQKSGWGDKATVTVSAESLGINTQNGEKFYILIHDTKTKKWYQLTGTAQDDEITIKTTRSGVVAIVTDAVN